MELRINKAYDRNGNELPKDFMLNNFKELEDFLAKTLKVKKSKVA